MSSKIIRLTEAEQLAQFFAGWDGHIEQVSRGRFDGNLRIFQGRLLRIASATFNQRIAFRGRDSSGMIAVYPVIDGMSTGPWLGCGLRPGQIIVVGPNYEVTHCSHRQVSDWCLYVPVKVLIEVIKVPEIPNSLGLPRTATVYSAAPETVDILLRQIAQILERGLADPVMSETPEGDSLENECLRKLVAVLVSPVGLPERLQRSAKTELVIRADEFLRAHLQDSVDMSDLCGALGANDRTLRFAFREHFGIGPMAYFKLLKLNAIRRRLRNGSQTSIKAAAEEFGIRHLGNLAADYRRHFDENPSETSRLQMPT